MMNKQQIEARYSGMDSAQQSKFIRDCPDYVYAYSPRDGRGMRYVFNHGGVKIGRAAAFQWAVTVDTNPYVY